MATPYDEQQVKGFIADSIAEYTAVDRALDPDFAVWTARMQFDAVGLGYPPARKKQLALLHQALAGTPPPEPPGPEPPPSHLPELTIRGHVFEQGAVYFTAIQCSDFNLLNRWQHGEDIEPVLDQRRRCNFNLLRVWTAYDIPGIGTFLDIDYSRVPAFVERCARYGLYVEFCGYTGINDPAHWPQLCDAARQSTPRPLLELVNELDQNTNEPDSEGRVFHLEDYSQPEGLLTSHGSNGSEAWPVTPYWDYATMHFNDAYEWQRKVGHNAMEVWNGPTLSNENSRFCDKQSNTDLGHDAAAGAALLCAGSCFHSVGGKTSDLWDAEQAAAARAWAQGALSVHLGYQDGAYRHASELETPDLLRVYQRTYNDDRGAETVEIRKAPAVQVAQQAAEDLLTLSEVVRGLFAGLLRALAKAARGRAPQGD